MCDATRGRGVVRGDTERQRVTDVIDQYIRSRRRSLYDRDFFVRTAVSQQIAVAQFLRVQLMGTMLPVTKECV